MKLVQLLLLLLQVSLFEAALTAASSASASDGGSSSGTMQLRRMATTKNDGVPDCYEVEASAISSAPPPGDPDQCAGQVYFYDYRNAETREGLVSVRIGFSSCADPENSKCLSIGVNGTNCDCVYNATQNAITMTGCDPGADGAFDPVEQTIGLTSGDYFQLASCDRPQPWKVNEGCLVQPPLPRDDAISFYPREGFCYAESYGTQCSGEYSNGCAFRNRKWNFYNPTHGEAGSEIYARAEHESVYGCEDTSHIGCQVNATSILDDDESATPCNSCEVDPATGNVISVDCSNINGVSLTTTEEGGWQIDETEEMCQHPAAVFAEQFYSYCKAEDSDGRVDVDDLTDGICFAVDRGRCRYVPRASYNDNCETYKRSYRYYNKNNSTSEDSYGEIVVEVALKCADDEDNQCSIEVDGTKCSSCEQDREKITTIDCSNLPEESTLQVEDQAFSLFYDYPEIVSTEDMCSHPAVEAQLGCINGSAISGQWPSYSDGQIVPGKCFAVDSVFTSSRWCDDCSTGTADHEYYNQASSGDRDVYANVQIVQRSNCYVGQECSIIIGDYTCNSCLLGEEGEFASIDCSNVPDDAMIGSLAVSEDGWSIEFVGTEEMCEHPAVIEQTGGDDGLLTTTPAMRGGSLTKDMEQQKEGATKLTVPSQLRFFFHNGKGQHPFSEQATSVLSSATDFMETQFASAFDSVGWSNLHMEYDQVRFPDRWIIKFDAHLVLTPGFSDMTEKQAANFLAGSNWDHYLNGYSRKALMPHARKVIFRAVSRNVK